MSEENEVIKNLDENKKVKKKKEKKVKNVDPNKVKFSEKFALKFKKAILADTFRTFLIVATLLSKDTNFVSLNQVSYDIDETFSLISAKKLLHKVSTSIKNSS